MPRPRSHRACRRRARGPPLGRVHTRRAHKLRVARPDVELGSLHPLQSLPSFESALPDSRGRGARSTAPPKSSGSRSHLGMRPFRVSDADRVAYHAAATVASNHLVALLGQAARLAHAAGVPPAAAPARAGDARERRDARPRSSTHRPGGARRRRHRAAPPISNALGISNMEIASGAGHDARYLHYICPTAMIFIPCKAGISHNEAECIEKEHAVAGARVLAEVVLDLANAE